MSDPAPDVIYTIWQNDNSRCAIVPEDAALVDRAMQLWATSARTRDTWLSLSTPEGGSFSVLASTITSAMLSTAAQRRECTFREKTLDDERAENRRDAGYVESE